MKAKARQAAMRSSIRTRSGLFAMVCLSVLGLAAFLGTGAPAAGAAEGECPNEAIRIEQGSTHLPDCRAWEQVSLADKNNTFPLEGITASLDGNRVLYTLVGGVSIAPTGTRPVLLATRGEGGWASASPLPPRTEMVAAGYVPQLATPDLSEWVASAQESFGGPEQSPFASLVRLDDEGAQETLHTFPVYFGANGLPVIGSKDLSRVYINGNDPIDPSHQAGTNNVYDFAQDPPQLVSRMPGTDVAPTCGLPSTTEAVTSGFGLVRSENWVSDDGSRVFFLTRGDTAPACSGLLQLYVRNVDAGTTTLISGPALPGDPELAVNQFLQATADGSSAVFRTPASLDPADDVDLTKNDQDIYRWDESSGQRTCLTCVVPKAQVLPGRDKAAVSADLSHVYFTSAQKLTSEGAVATAGAPNLYVLSDGVLHYIGRVDANSATNRVQIAAGQVTPDGGTFVFRSGRAELDALSGSVNNGKQQFYRYDDDDQSLTCISCPPGGAQASVPSSLAANQYSVKGDVRIMTDDGETIFFPTPDPLVKGDVNQVTDIYEWHSGSVGLVTNGTTVDQLGGGAGYPKLLGIAAGGRDVFFVDVSRLTWDAQDSTLKIFDARIDGGFAQPSGPPASCVADACFGLTSPPGTLPAGSDAFGGAETVKDSPSRRRCRVGRRPVRVDGKTRCLKKAAGKGRKGSRHRAANRNTGGSK